MPSSSFFFFFAFDAFFHSSREFMFDARLASSTGGCSQVVRLPVTTGTHKHDIVGVVHKARGTARRRGMRHTHMASATLWRERRCR